MSEIPIGTLCLVRCPVCSARVGGTAVVTDSIRERCLDGAELGRPGFLVFARAYEITGRLGVFHAGPRCITPITPPDDPLGFALLLETDAMVPA